MKDKGKNNVLSHFLSRGIRTAWIFVGAVGAVLMLLLFILIWKPQHDSDVNEECRLVVNALKEQRVRESVLMDCLRSTEKTKASIESILAAAAYEKGDLSAEKVRKLCLEKMPKLEQLWIREGSEVRALIGTTDEAEFEQRKELLEKEGQPDSENDSEPLTLVDGKSCWIASSLPSEEDNVFVIGKWCSKLFDKPPAEDYLSPQNLLDRSSPPTNGFLISIDLETGLVDGLSGNVPTGIAVGDVFNELPNKNGRLTIGDVSCNASVAETDEQRFLAGIAAGKRQGMTVVLPWLGAGVFILLFILTLLYVYDLRTDIAMGRVPRDFFEDPGSDRFFKEIRRKIIQLFFSLLAVICILILIVLLFFSFEIARRRAEQYLNDIKKYYEVSDYNTNYVRNRIDNELVATASTIAALIKEAPELADSEYFLEIGPICGEDLFVLDGMGVPICATSNRYDLSGLRDDTSEMYTLSSVLAGMANEKTLTIRDGDQIDSIWYAVKRTDTPGMVLICNEDSGNLSATGWFSRYLTKAGHVLFSVSTDSGLIHSCSVPSYVGMSISEIGMKDDAMRGGYVGTMTLFGNRYFCVTVREGDMVGCMAQMSYDIIMDYFFQYVSTVIVGGVLVLLMLLLIFKRQKGYWSLLAKRVARQVKKKGKDKAASPADGSEPEGDDEADVFYSEERGSLNTQTSAGFRVNYYIRRSYQDLYANEKFVLCLKATVIILTLLVLLAYIFGRGYVGDSLVYLMNKTWDMGINIYAICYDILYVLIVYMIVLLIKRFLNLIGENFGPRGETIARLLDSLVNYASILLAGTICIMNLGVDTTTLLASVGIAGLGLSLGAKDLIMDVIAGISIIFEGEFRAGDIVEISGKRGKVQDIGIRTTKLIADGNVRIFRNSLITDVLNMTKAHSVAEVHFKVGRSYLELAEEVFVRAIPDLEKQIDGIEEDVRYQGICEMDTVSVTLVITAKCQEQNRSRVIRGLYREINHIMQENNIPASG